MRLKPWAIMPTAWIGAGVLQQFQWKEDGSAGTAALMIYFVLCQLASPRPLRASEKQEPEKEAVAAPQAAGSIPIYDDLTELTADTIPPWLKGVHSVASSASLSDPDGKVLVPPNPSILQTLGGWGNTTSANPSDLKTEVTDSEIPDSLVARATYDDLAMLAGLSRARVSAGLQKLLAMKMIWRVDQSSTYGLSGYGPGKRWAKLPGQALLSDAGTTFQPYTHFRLRSRTELNAVKLHFYYASTRGKNALYSMVAYPMIQMRTGISEREIPRANSLLVSCGILARTRGLPSEDAMTHESNKYYLTGYDSFIPKKAA